MRTQEKANLVTTRRENVENISPRPPQHNPNLLPPPKNINNDLVRVWQSQAGNWYSLGVAEGAFFAKKEKM